MIVLLSSIHWLMFCACIVNRDQSTHANTLFHYWSYETILVYFFKHKFMVIIYNIASMRMHIVLPWFMVQLGLFITKSNHGIYFNGSHIVYDSIGEFSCLMFPYYVIGGSVQEPAWQHQTQTIAMLIYKYIIWRRSAKYLRDQL